MTSTRAIPGVRLSSNSYTLTTARQRQRPPAQVTRSFAHNAGAQLRPRGTDSLVFKHTDRTSIDPTCIVEVRADRHSTASIRQRHDEPALVLSRLAIDVATQLSPRVTPDQVLEHTHVASIVPRRIIQ